ncbi:MAG: hypothetical protein OEY14_17305 [Myxococcales bacterium]|nr:hypothetical protein [Myxococcales bacterium]
MRPITHRYVDPLDAIWVAAARRVGLEVRRSSDVHAATDGRGLLWIGTPEILDPDDCLAQIIFHELTHAVVQGPSRFHEPDWGLDNVGEPDLPAEHACLRLQAALADRWGLRQVLGPTTDFRAYYDALGADPLSDASVDSAAGREDPSVPLARAALARVHQPPWGPHLEHALQLTARIVELTVEAGVGALDAAALGLACPERSCRGAQGAAERALEPLPSLWALAGSQLSSRGD